MKYIEKFELFEGVNLKLTEEEYLQHIAKLTLSVFKEDTDWKEIKNWHDVETAFDIDSEADNSLNYIFDAFAVRMLSIALNDCIKYLYKKLNEYGTDAYEAIYKGYQGNLVIDYICECAYQFPLLKMEEGGKKNFKTDILNFFRTKPKIVNNWNLIKELEDILSNFVNESIQTSDIYFNTFTENYIKGVYPKIRKIIEKNPKLIDKLEEMECTVSVPQIIADKLRNEKDWLGRGIKSGLLGFKN